MCALVGYFTSSTAQNLTAHWMLLLIFPVLLCFLCGLCFFIMAIRGPASQSMDNIKRNVALSNVETVDSLKLISLCRVSVFPLKILSISGPF